MKAKIMLYGLEETIDRKIDITVGRDLKAVMGLDKDIYTVYSDDDSRKIRRGGGIGGSSTDNTILREYVSVVAEEDGTDNDDVMMHPERYNHFQVFNDPEIGVRVGTLKYNKVRTITFSYWSKSKTLINSMVLKINTFKIYNYGQKKHMLEYHYDIPQQLMHFLNEVNTLKNKRLEDDEKLDIVGYIKKYQVQFISRNNTPNQTPHKFNLSVREKIYDVEGMMSTDAYTVKKVKGDHGYYGFQIEYKIWYAKPVALVLDFPLLIWNSPLNPKYTNAIARPPQRHMVQGWTDPMYNGLYDYSRPNASTLYPIKKYTPLTIPTYDQFDFWPREGSYKNIASFLIVVDENDPYSIMNIKNIPFHYIRKTFIKYMLTFPEDTTTLFNGLFNFVLYKNDQEDMRNKLILDNEGNLTTMYPMQLKSTYRVIIRVLLDLDKIPTRELDKLNNYIQEEVHDYYKKITEAAEKEIEESRDFTKPFKLPVKYYVDEFGNVIDEEGYVINNRGERIIEKIICDDEMHNQD